GYSVQRLGTSPGVACNSSTLLAAGTTACDDSVPVNGTYTYTVTAVYRSWTAVSGQSGSVTVLIDHTAPSTGYSLNPVSNSNGWNNSASVSVTLSATDNSGGSGGPPTTPPPTGAQPRHPAGVSRP